MENQLQNKTKSFIVSFFQNYKKMLPLVLGFALFHCLTYFGLQQIVSFDSVHIVSLPIDYKIPLIEWFIIPYVLWYGYVLFGIVFFMIRSKDEFTKFLKCFIIGDIICVLTYIIYPNGIDFRPETINSQSPFYNALFTWIYSSDKPMNVCPSLHCYVSLIVNNAICTSRFFKKNYVVKILSTGFALLVCFSTLFVKQHSVIDFAVSAAISIVIYFIVYKGKKKEQHTQLN